MKIADEMADETIVKLLWDHDPEILDELRALDTGMENFPNLDSDWIWVAEENGVILASLFAAPAHGTAILLRLNSKAQNPMTVRTLLSVALQSIKKRGYSMFFSFLDTERINELKLVRLAKRYGCQLTPFAGVIVAGRIK